MAIDTVNEELLTLNEARKFLPSVAGKHISLPSIWRWCRKGIQGVRLEYVRVGRRICTTRSAIDRFLNNLAAADRELVNTVKEVHLRCLAARDMPLASREEQAKRARESLALSKKILGEAGIWPK